MHHNGRYLLPNDAKFSPSLSANELLVLGHELAPGLPLQEEHADSPEIRKLLLNMRQKRLIQASQYSAFDVDSRASQNSMLAGMRDAPNALDYSSCIRDCTTEPTSDSPPELPSQEQYFGFGNTEAGLPNEQHQPSRSRAVSLLPCGRKSHDVSQSPHIQSLSSSASTTPDIRWHYWSPEELHTPGSTERSGSGATNTAVYTPSKNPSLLPFKRTSLDASILSGSRAHKRRRSQTVEPSELTPVTGSIPIDLESASYSAGQRRQRERKASAEYRQRKKSKSVDHTMMHKELATKDTVPDKRDDINSANLAPPTSTEMTFSSSQQSFKSTLSGSSQISAMSASTQISDGGTSHDDWPNLPELHPGERRKKIDYRPLIYYGTPELIQTYPSSFQASLHRVMDLQRVTHLRSISHRVLFVYGSLMISDLLHDVFINDREWIFHSEVVRYCMCPARVRGYSRFAVHGMDEPVMIKAEKNAPAYTHGMLIFGLTKDHFRILDRYLFRGFKMEEVPARVNLKASTTDFPVSTYVWPEAETQPTPANSIRINREVEWTVERFWKDSMACQIWRDSMEAARQNIADMQLKQASEQYSMASVIDFENYWMDWTAPQEPLILGDNDSFWF